MSSLSNLVALYASLERQVYEVVAGAPHVGVMKPTVNGAFRTCSDEHETQRPSSVLVWRQAYNLLCKGARCTVGGGRSCVDRQRNRRLVVVVFFLSAASCHRSACDVFERRSVQDERR